MAIRIVKIIDLENIFRDFAKKCISIMSVIVILNIFTKIIIKHSESFKILVYHAFILLLKGRTYCTK